MLQGLLLLTEDADADFCDLLAVGVPLGVDIEMPRTPEVFEEKVKWMLNMPEDGATPRDMRNYGSAEDNEGDHEAVHG